MKISAAASIGRPVLKRPRRRQVTDRDLAADIASTMLPADPPGTRGGYDDLRRAASREPLGRGLRPRVASIGDLARMLAALGREQDRPALQQLRHLSELERTLSRGIER